MVVSQDIFLNITNKYYFNSLSGGPAGIGGPAGGICGAAGGGGKDGAGRPARGGGAPGGTELGFLGSKIH